MVTGIEKRPEGWVATCVCNCGNVVDILAKSIIRGRKTCGNQESCKFAKNGGLPGKAREKGSKSEPAPTTVRCRICLTLKDKGEFRTKRGTCTDCMTVGKPIRDRKLLVTSIPKHVSATYGCMNPACQWRGRYASRMLDFHHLDPSKKDFTISRSDMSKAEVIAEIRKCVCLCANCHRMVHAELIDVSNIEPCKVNDDGTIPPNSRSKVLHSSDLEALASFV